MEKYGKDMVRHEDGEVGRHKFLGASNAGVKSGFFIFVTGADRIQPLWDILETGGQKGGDDDGDNDDDDDGDGTDGADVDGGGGDGGGDSDDNCGGWSTDVGGGEVDDHCLQLLNAHCIPRFV